MAACQGDVICNGEVFYCLILQKPKFLHAYRSLIRDRYICTVLAVDVHNNVIPFMVIVSCFSFQYIFFWPLCEWYVLRYQCKTKSYSVSCVQQCYQLW